MARSKANFNLLPLIFYLFLIALMSFHIDAVEGGIYTWLLQSVVEYTSAVIEQGFQIQLN